jgi:hypothetical protein
MTTQYTKSESSELLAANVEEFYANGGVKTLVKTKKDPREFRGKAIKDGGRLGTMGPKMKNGGNDGKSA